MKEKSKTKRDSEASFLECAKTCWRTAVVGLDLSVHGGC